MFTDKRYSKVFDIPSLYLLYFSSKGWSNGTNQFLLETLKTLHLSPDPGLGYSTIHSVYAKEQPMLFARFPRTWDIFLSNIFAQKTQNCLIGRAEQRKGEKRP